jgi:hypothetical protein
MGKIYTERSLESKNWSNLKVNLKFIVQTYKYPQKNWKGRSSDERTSKVLATLCQLSTEIAREQLFDQFLLSSDFNT